MKNLLLFAVFCCGVMVTACGQKIPQDRAHCVDKKFDKEVAGLLSFSIPTIGPDELKKMKEPLILDAREYKEFVVSHIPNAKYIGYNKMNLSAVEKVNKDQPIVLYCSVGYRSEKIGEKLKKLGYTNVKNLYGSIFEWVNEGNHVVNMLGDTTKKIHAYDKNWGKWIKINSVRKVY